jgi:hypothetical protein
MNIRKGLQQLLLALIRSRSYAVKPTGPLQVTSDPKDNQVSGIRRRRAPTT